MGALFVKDWVRSRGRAQFEIIDRNIDKQITEVKKLDSKETFDLTTAYGARFRSHQNCFLRFEEFEEDMAFVKISIQDSKTKTVLLKLRCEINSIRKVKAYDQKNPEFSSLYVYTIE
jgi:hypothetical protein